MHDYATHDGPCRRREYSTWALLISSLKYCKSLCGVIHKPYEVNQR
nr:MAG TPA: hypothetical protein [Caudoviricetes sp.]